MISEYLGFDSDYIILGLAGVVIILLILIITNMVQIGKLKKRYKVFMSGKTAKSLEDTIIKRLDEVDELVAANSSIKKNIEELFANMKCSYQKVGLVKYDAFNETGGKLSEETVAWMKTQLEEAKKQGVTVIPVSHHNLLDESTLYPEECTIENTKEVTALLEAYGVPVYLSGHLHLQRIKKHTSNLNTPGGYGIREIVTSPLPMAPCQYSILNWQTDGSLSYHTKKVDIAGWAQRYGEEDENLLNFDAYADQFLVDVISKQAFKALQSASKDIKEEMARLYADMNRDYCSGTKIDVAKIRKSEAYQYWIRYSGNDFWLARLQAILHDARTDNTVLELKAGVDFPLPGETIENPENAEKEETVGADAGSPAEEIQKKEESYGLRGNCIQTAE